MRTIKTIGTTIRTTIKSIAVLLILPLTWINGAMAQEAQRAVPAEVYVCNFADGKDMEDLDRVVNKWNKWSDANEPAPYVAWTLTPQFYGPNVDYDVVWLGAWNNGTDMAKSMQSQRDNGSDILAEFEKVTPCASHASIASVNVRPPQIDPETTQGVVAFSSCTIAEGKTGADAYAAEQEFAAFLDKVGAKAGTWMFWPMTGTGGENSPDYRRVMSFDGYEEFGRAFEGRTNGGGYLETAKIFGGVVSCEGPRVYDSTLRRNSGVNVNS